MTSLQHRMGELSAALKAAGFICGKFSGDPDSTLLAVDTPENFASDTEPHIPSALVGPNDQRDGRPYGAFAPGALQEKIFAILDPVARRWRSW